MANGIDDLEAHLAGRRRRGAPPSRNARQQDGEGGAEAEAARVAEERENARRERARREADEKAAAEAKAAAQDLARQEQEERRAAEGDRSRTESEPRPKSAAAKSRPKATPVYLDPDIEDWLWEVKQTAARLHVDVPVSAVARKALRTLMGRQTPAQVVAELSSSVDVNEGKRGRPRR